MRSKERLPTLDALRGLAAVSVVFYHALMVFPVFLMAYSGQETGDPLAALLISSPLRLLSAGHEAVILFFVLSGFVLALPIMDGRPPAYRSFVARRVFRIYVPYLVVMLGGAVALNAFSGYGMVGLSEAYNHQWTQPVTTADALPIGLMVHEALWNVNSPAWSLAHEMRVSLAFPLIAFFVCRARWKVALLAAFGLPVIALRVGPVLPSVQVLQTSLLPTLYYSGLFIGGATLAKYRQPIANRWRTLPGWGRAVLFMGALGLYGGSWFWTAGLVLGDQAIGVAAALLITIALNEPLARQVLAWAPLQWLGRVSYSLYLSHLIVLFTLIYTVGARTSVTIAVLLFPLVALLVAAVLHRAVEAPCQRLGRALAARLATGPAHARAENAGPGVLLGRRGSYRTSPFA